MSSTKSRKISRWCRKRKLKTRSTVKPKRSKYQRKKSSRTALHNGSGARTNLNRNRLAKRKARREADLDSLIEQSPPAFRNLFIKEPKLVFAHNCTSVDPRTGIDEFGPFLTVNPIIRLAIVG